MKHVLDRMAYELPPDWRSSASRKGQGTPICRAYHPDEGTAGPTRDVDALIEEAWRIHRRAHPAAEPGEQLEMAFPEPQTT